MRTVLRCWLVWILLACSASAIDVNSLQPQGYLSDFANVTDAASRAAIERYSAAVEKATGAQLAIVTVDTLDGVPIEDFANDLFRRWGVGKKGTDEGVMLLLAVKDRQSRLEVGRGLEPIITDGTAGALLREMRPELRQNNYGGALLTAAQSLGQRIANSKGVQIAEYTPKRRVREPAGSNIPWPILLGGIFLFFLIFGRGGRSGGGGGGGGLLPGLILGNMMGRSRYGGYSGGGFGGYDSGGGGFGGFGGGDSGGGGASSNW